MNAKLQSIDLKAMDRGAKAEALLNSEVFKEAFANVRELLLKRLEDWSFEDPAGAEKTRLMLKLLRDVRANIEQAAKDGKFSSLRLDHERRTLSPAEWAGNDNRKDQV